MIYQQQQYITGRDLTTAILFVVLCFAAFSLGHTVGADPVEERKVQQPCKPRYTNEVEPISKRRVF